MGVDNIFPVKRQGKLGDRIPVAAVTDFVFPLAKISDMRMPQFRQIAYRRFGSEVGIACNLVELRIDVI